MNYVSALIVSAGLIVAFALSAWIEHSSRGDVPTAYNYSDDMFIQAVGEASMRVDANSVEWRLSIRKAGKTAKESFKKIEATRIELTEYLLANGLKERDLSYEPMQLQDDGLSEKYNATQQIRVFTDDIATVEKIINNSAAASENVLSAMRQNDRYDSLIYRYSEHNGYDELYAEAVANAAKKAQAIAKIHGKEVAIARSTNASGIEVYSEPTGATKTRVITARAYVDYALK
ncbi:hypothetical protein FACS1894103_7480 [Campylobacterota bacterium]|nr:hypothetical protein FACS1894103_7480 [Campylobacterota bacterium]